MKKTYIFFLFLFFGYFAFGQQISIKDEVTHQPVEFATLHSKSLNQSAITNVNGQADIASFRGATDITIRMMGYQTKTISFQEIEEMNFEIFLNHSEFHIDGVVISASRWIQKKTDVPNKIVSISASEIAFQNPQTAADMLAGSGQIFIQKSQLGGGSPMIRGFAANRVLISVDGVRMNNAIFRSGNLQNVISIDPFAVNNTEVVFGPGSLIYGSDAIGGVMNFYTLKPVLATNEKPLIKGSATTRFSTANLEKTGHFDINIGLKKWAFVTSASYSDYGNLRMGKNGPAEYQRPEYAERINGVDSVVKNPNPNVQAPTGFNQVNLMQKIRFKLNQDWDFNYGFIYSTTSDYPRYDRLIRYKDDHLRYAEWYYGPQTWMMNNLKIVNTKTGKFYSKLAITLAHQYFKESRHDRDFGKSIRQNRTEKVNVISANVDFEKKWQKHQNLYYGIEILADKVNSTGDDLNIDTGEETPGPSRYPDGSTWNSYAVYANYLNNITDKISFQGGLRYNYVTLRATFDTTFYPFPFTQADLNNGALTGSAGLTYNPSVNWLLYANLSTGFRAPNIDDVGKVFDSEPGRVIVPNPDLVPEYAWNGELGITKMFGEKVELDLAAFYTYLDKAMVRRDYQIDGQDSIIYDGEMSKVEAIQNAAYAVVWGFSADIEANLPAGFGISASYNYQKGEEEQDDGTTAPLRHAAPVFGTAHLTYSRNRLKVDLYGVFNGEIPCANLAPSERNKAYIYAYDANGNPYSPSWYTINVKLLYQFTDYLMVNVGLENITDQRYRPYSSGIAGPGMNFIASLKFTF